MVVARISVGAAADLGAPGAQRDLEIHGAVISVGAVADLGNTAVLFCRSLQSRASGVAAAADLGNTTVVSVGFVMVPSVFRDL